MANYLRNIRKFRITSRKENEEKEEKKERSPFWALILKGLKDGLSSTIVKWVGIVLTFLVVTVGGWLINNTYIDPIRPVLIQGYVYEVNSAGKPLSDAVVFVVGHREVQFEANKSGHFSGEVKVRKSTRELTLSCNLDGYKYFQKKVDVPVEKGEGIRTNFQLEPL